MFKKFILMLMIAAMVSNCEDDPLADIPNLEGQWILSRSVWTMTSTDTTMSGDESFNTTDPLQWQMVLNIDATNISFCENELATVSYTCVVETPYEQLSDSIMTVNDENDVPEEVVYAATGNSFVIYFEGDEQDDGTTYHRNSAETFTKYTGSWPPTEWTTVQDDPALNLVGYWIMEFIDWTRYENGAFVESGIDTTDLTDPYDWEELIQFTADSVIFCKNDAYSVSYECEADEGYEVDGTDIIVSGFGEDGQYYENTIPFTLAGDDLAVSVVEDHTKEDGTVVREEMDMTMVRYTGTFPPDEWGIALTNPVLGKWVFGIGREYLTDAAGEVLISRSDTTDIDDPASWREVLEFTEISLLIYEYDWAIGGYTTETGTWDLDGDYLELMISEDDGSTEHMGFEFEVTDEGLSLKSGPSDQMETHEENGVQYTGYPHMDLTLVSYPLTAFPPPEWADPYPEHITVSLNGEASVKYNQPDGSQAAYIVTGTWPDGPIPDSTTYVTASNYDEEGGGHISITFKGNTARTYNISAVAGGGFEGTANFDVFYQASGTEQYGYSSGGEVIVTTYGAVGGLIEGTFDVVVYLVDNNGPVVTSTATLAGSFRVERSADGTLMDD